MLNAAGGLILVTGPTASGKTTTLYSCLEFLNDGRRKINTIEDPIEYAINGVRQSQVNPVLKVDFLELLRNVLRQSPDVIMIGEIRDPLTAQTAVRAAGSGQLVLATLHAPTAASAIHSLLHLDVHPHFFAGCLRGVVAQRLVRTLCPECKVGYDLSEAPLTSTRLRPGSSRAKGSNSSRRRVARPAAKAAIPIGSACSKCSTPPPPSAGSWRKARPRTTSSARRSADGMVEFRRSGLLKVAQGVPAPRKSSASCRRSIWGPTRRDGQAQARRRRLRRREIWPRMTRNAQDSAVGRLSPSRLSWSSIFVGTARESRPTWSSIFAGTARESRPTCSSIFAGTARESHPTGAAFARTARKSRPTWSSIFVGTARESHPTWSSIFGGTARESRPTCDPRIPLSKLSPALKTRGHPRRPRRHCRK